MRHWFEQSAGVAQSAEAIGLKPIQCGFDSHHQHQSEYAYLLGMSIGEGCISRAPWQVQIVERHAGRFVGGLIESDGCRHRRIVAGKNDPAYSLTNHSRGIPDLFVAACSRLGLHPRQADAVTISIARRSDVARLDALMGPTVQEPGLS